MGYYAKLNENDALTRIAHEGVMTNSLQVKKTSRQHIHDKFQQSGLKKAYKSL